MLKESASGYVHTMVKHGLFMSIFLSWVVGGGCLSVNYNCMSEVISSCFEQGYIVFPSCLFVFRCTVSNNSCLPTTTYILTHAHI